MKRNLFLTLLMVILFTSCRKVDNDTVKQHFFDGEINDPRSTLIIKKLMQLDVQKPFSSDIERKYGKPSWEDAKVYKSDSNSTTVAYPFYHKGKTAHAIIIANTRKGDLTSYIILDRQKLLNDVDSKRSTAGLSLAFSLFYQFDQLSLNFIYNDWKTLWNRSKLAIILKETAPTAVYCDLELFGYCLYAFCTDPSANFQSCYSTLSGGYGGTGTAAGSIPNDGNKFTDFRDCDGDGVILRDEQCDPAYQLEQNAQALDAFTAGSAFGFIDRTVECALLAGWLELAKFNVPSTIKTQLYNYSDYNQYYIPGFGFLPSYHVYYVLDIDKAYSKVVNLDYFSVEITTLPTVNGTQLTASQFKEYIRLNMNSFVSDATFYPYNNYGLNFTSAWNSSNPIGSIIGIELIPIEHGSVVTSAFTNSTWRFSTIFEPVNLLHPMSGNREFGITNNINGSYTVYTEGVDRFRSAAVVYFQKNFPTPYTPFTRADNLWKSFQDKVVQFVNSHGGVAVKHPPVIIRPNWSLIRQIIEGKISINTLSKNCY